MDITNVIELGKFDGYIIEYVEGVYLLNNDIDDDSLEVFLWSVVKTQCQLVYLNDRCIGFYVK